MVVNQQRSTGGPGGNPQKGKALEAALERVSVVGRAPWAMLSKR